MSARNPDLPILDELGAEFEALVGAATAAGEDGGRTARTVGAADPHAPRRRLAPTPTRAARERGAQARRIGRRAAIMLVLICLVGGVAFAALRGGGSGNHAHTSPALLGRDAGGAWSFSVYRDQGRLCTIFVPRGGELSGNCGAAPDHGGLRAGSAIAAGHRYVFGVVGTGVDRVTAALAAGVARQGAAVSGEAAGARRAGATRVRRPGDLGAAREAGFPVGDGWFVVDLGPADRDGQPAAPAVVTPLTRHGHRTGPPYVDCSLGVLNPACRQRIESAARG